MTPGASSPAAGLAGLLLATACSACSSPAPSSRDGGVDPLRSLQPTAPRNLSPGNLTGQDEDPSIVAARDGSLYAAWYSNRLGLQPSGRERKEIFVARSTDGVTWTDPPAQATESEEWSFYPSLAQDAGGAFHLTFMRWHLKPAGCVPSTPGCPGGPTCCTGLEKRVLYTSSPDGLTWDRANAQEIAAGPADELASLVAASDGRLLVYYVSGYRHGDTDKQIFVRVREGAGWGSPALAAEVSSTSHHDTFPHVVERSPNDFLVTWTRYDLSAGDTLFHPSMQTMLSTSTGGLVWTPPVVLSGEADPPTVDVFPYAYPDHSRGTWFVAWVTPGGVVDLPVGGTYPGDLEPLDLPGYTPRIAPTVTPGIYFAAWAEGEEPRQKVRYRFFAK
jgi:hypothetical protein